MLGNSQNDIFSPMLKEIQVSSEQFLENLHEQLESIQEDIAHYEPLEVLSFSAGFWSFDHPEQNLMLPYVTSLLNSVTFKKKKKQFCEVIGHEWLKKVKELFLKSSLHAFSSKQNRLNGKELNLFFESLFHDLNQPYCFNSERRLSNFLDEKKSSKSKEILRELFIQIEKLKEGLKGSKKGALLDPSLFLLDLKNNEFEAKIKSLSIDFDESRDFLADAANASLKPFVCIEGRVYCFCPQLISESFLTLYFSLENQKNAQKNQVDFTKQRAYDSLCNLFSSEYVFLDATLSDTHPKSAASEIKTDLIVVYDNVFLCFNFQESLDAKRQYPENIKGVFSCFEGKIYEPVSRARKVLNFVSQVKHFSIKSNKGVIDQVVEASRLEKGYFICVTSEKLGAFLPRANFAPSLSLYDRRDPFWLLSLADFDYLSNHFSNATDFILFIERRLAASFHLDPFEEVSEEAFLANYKENQLLQLRQDKFSEYMDFFIKNDWEPDLKASSTENSALLDESYNALIASVEQSKQKGSFEVTSFLVNLPTVYQRRLMKMFNIERESFLKDGKGHGFSRYFKEFASGVTLFCANRETLDSFWGKMYQYVNNKVMQADCKQWMLITEVYKSGKRVGYDFRIYKGLQKEHHSDLGF
ncbi:hypothetical protein AB751O23_AW_00060 [Chlamydiales bacterium SCGC AB-751-O23]|nr:hypothetical protein AB751O23_AW_00060 [Chlamydiales bacterium SCGC AB-751-O23]